MWFTNHYRRTTLHVEDPDLSNTQQVLQWSPEVSFQDGMADTIAYFRSIFVVRSDRFSLCIPNIKIDSIPCETRICEALQKVMNDWNSIFDVAENVGDVFCFYISPFPSTMLTARHLHADALPLKGFFYCTLRGRRTILSPRFDR